MLAVLTKAQIFFFLRIILVMQFLLLPASISADLKQDFFDAAQKGDISGIKKALADKIDVNVRGKYGITALMIAAFYGQTDAVRLLLASGADIYSRADEGSTAYSLAIERWHKEIALVLTEAHEKNRPKDILRVPGSDLIEAYEPSLIEEIRNDIRIAMNRLPPRNIFFSQKNRHRVTKLETTGALYLFHKFSSGRRQIRLHNYGLLDDSVKVEFSQLSGVKVHAPLIKDYMTVPAGAEVFMPIEFSFAEFNPGKTYSLMATIRARDGYVHDTMEIMLYQGDSGDSRLFFDKYFAPRQQRTNLVSYVSAWVDTPYEDPVWDAVENPYAGVTIRIRPFKNPLPFFSNFVNQRYNPLVNFEPVKQVKRNKSRALHFKATNAMIPQTQDTDLPVEISCLFPLDRGNWWLYQVKSNGKEKSELRLNIGEPDTIHLTTGYHLSWKYLWLNEKSNIITAGELIQANVAEGGADGSVFFYTRERNRLSPFVNQYMSLGEKIDDLVLMNIYSQTLNDKEFETAYFASSNGEHIEKFTKDIGLTYLKRGHLEMHLVDYFASNTNCTGGLAPKRARTRKDAGA